MMKKSIYLPTEGLQGEDIPSHILWEDIDFKSIQISFRPPLKLKEIYNSKSKHEQDNNLIVQKVEYEGYLGLLFESSKISELEYLVPVEYSFNLLNGEIVKETREIRLFRPELEIRKLPEEITVDLDKGTVQNPIRIKNVGRGTLMLSIFSTENSPIKIETPSEKLEFMRRFKSELHIEMSNLAKQFPQFQPYVDEMFELLQEEMIELSKEERKKIKNFQTRLSSVLASNEELRQGYVEAFLKAFLKNTDLIEKIGSFVKLLESFVSKNILLINPFDVLNLSENEQEITLKFKQTDSVDGEYDDITLPNIKLKLIGSKAGKLPVYRLFKWEKEK
jgi:hypothetical protein